MDILKKEIPISLNLLYKVVVYLSITVFIIIIGNLIVAKLNNDLETITKLLVPLGVLLSAALASISVLKSVENTDKIARNKYKIETSKFYLEKSIDGLNTVYNLLENQNNDRVIWIQASRVLWTSQNLSKKITEDSHKEVYKLQEFQIKHNLRRVFEYKPNTDAEFERLPLGFFAGLKNWETASMDEINQVINSHYTKNKLPEESIIAIFDFIKFPLNYNDPLDEYQIHDSIEEIHTWSVEGGLADLTSQAQVYLEKTLQWNNSSST